MTTGSGDSRDASHSSRRAASGIGARPAELFAAEGARVVVADRDAGPGEETVAAIEAAGGEATFAPRGRRGGGGGRGGRCRGRARVRGAARPVQQRGDLSREERLAGRHAGGRLGPRG